MRSRSIPAARLRVNGALLLVLCYFLLLALAGCAAQPADAPVFVGFVIVQGSEGAKGVESNGATGGASRQDGALAVAPDAGDLATILGALRDRSKPAPSDAGPRPAVPGPAVPE